MASVLSGNRNFEGRIQSQVRANYLASPPLVVAYALAGKMQVDLTSEPIGHDMAGEPVYLKDIWPPEREIQETMLSSVKSEMFRSKYAQVFDGDERWRSLPDSHRRAVRVDRRLDLHPQSAVLRRADARADAPVRHQPRARARRARRQRDDRSHLAGRIDPRRQPGGPLPHLEGGHAGGLQLVRRAARQSRSDDARHVRQHPPAQPARAGHRGGWTMLLPQEEVMTHLRRVGRVPRRRRAAARHRRQGVRHPDRRATGRRRGRCCSASRR